MAKLNNKGFSLIDLLIAVAVMALLVSPIIAQLSQTLRLSAEAKEKQYVVDSANEVLEYFRKYDDKELVAGDAEGLLEITSTPSKGTTRCKLVKSNGSAYNWYTTPSSYQDYVDYNWVKYEISPATDIGKDKESYKRVVVKTDLMNKLYEAGCQVDYETRSGSTLPSTLADDKFAIRSDNMVVNSTSKNGFSNNSDLYDDTKIGYVVVKSRPDVTTDNQLDLKDPNSIDIGNMQDIDATKMAIIPGDATSLDYQLETDLTAALVQYVNAHPSISYGDHVNDPDLLSQDMKNLILNPSATTKTRCIHLSVTCGKNSAGADAVTDGTPDYYHVRCDVVYRISFSGSELKLFNNNTSTAGVFTYNVLDRDYYVDTPPDVFLVYEPLLITTSSKDAAGGAANVYYAQNDAITITSDKYTSGVDPKTADDASRIYLIRSSENWQKATGAKTAEATDGLTKFDETKYYTYVNGEFKSVNININQIVTSDLSLEKPLNIYTNISNKNGMDYHGYGGFTVNNNPDGYGFPTIPSSVATGTRTSYDLDNIIKVQDEKGKGSDRLGQYTVTYQKLDGTTTTGEVTYFTGARGAD